MQLASAYPNSAISTGAMVAIAVVMFGCLVFWLVMVFVADRQRRNLGARQAAGPAEHGPAGDGAPPDLAHPVLAAPDETAEDESRKAGHGDGTRRIQPVGW